MTLSNSTPLSTAIPLSVAEIEKQIAKVIAELEKARALEYTIAEKTFLAAQKSAAAAQLKVQALLDKSSITPAAENRLILAKAALSEKESAMAIAAEKLNKIKAKHATIHKFKKKVKNVLVSKKLSKKIKFSRKEKAALKAFRKSEKSKNKIAKEAEKTTGQLSTQEHQPDASLNQANPN